jgi:hypothetical protein
MGERPRFLPAGWPERTGWRLPVRPAEVGEPWGSFLDIVARAQVGDFSRGDTLVELALSHGDELDHVAELAGAIASHAQLRRLFALVGTSRSFFVSVAANESHWLDFAEACIANRFDTELRPLFFSEFLERWHTPDDECLERGGHHGYLDRVRVRVAELRTRYPGVAHFAYGAPLHPRSYVELLASYAAAGDDELWEAAASISSWLFRLETLTGVRLPLAVTENEAYGRVISDAPIPGSPLRAIRFDPDGMISIERAAFVAALAALEEVELERFEPGRRYFCGHLVPD